MVVDTESLNDLFVRNYPNLLSWCRRHVQRRLGDPEDFVHQAFVRCHASWRRDRQSQQNPAAYLYRALRWVVVDRLRANARQAARDSGTCLTGSHKSGSNPLCEAAANEALDSLKGRERQVCQAVMAGKSTEQICSELQMTPNTLAVQLCRARARLQARLNSHER